MSTSMCTSWDQRGLVEDLLARGVDDWLDLGLIVDIARRAETRSEEGLTAVAMGLVCSVMVQGLMQPGAVVAGKFEPWVVTPGVALERIIREWLAVGTRDLRPGDVVWLRNTETGDGLGRSVLDREVCAE